MICQQCGMDFTPVRKDHIYCTKKCGHAHHRDANRGRYRQLARESYARNRDSRKQYRESNRESIAVKKRSGRLTRLYGITPDEYLALLQSQGGKCALCYTAEAKSRGGELVVDHDHETGRVRGLLCSPCNSWLGGYEKRRLELWRVQVYLDPSASVTPYRPSLGVDVHP